MSRKLRRYNPIFALWQEECQFFAGILSLSRKIYNHIYAGGNDGDDESRQAQEGKQPPNKKQRTTGKKKEFGYVSSKSQCLKDRSYSRRLAGKERKRCSRRTQRSMLISTLLTRLLLPRKERKRWTRWTTMNLAESYVGKKQRYLKSLVSFEAPVT